MKPVFTLIFILCCLLSFSQKNISIDSISSYKNELVTVCGQVFETKFSDETQTTFIDLEGLHPNAPLTVVVFGKARANFKEGQEELYKGKRICVTGVVKEYTTRFEIVVTKPDEIFME